MSKILAVDLGVSSFGYSILQATESANRYVCVDNSVCMRDIPYNESGESAQKEHSAYRSMRRLIQKRKKRIRCVAKVFEDFGLLAYHDALQVNDPAFNSSSEHSIKNRWHLRAVDTWQRPLSKQELFALFAHMAKHRGYKSIARDDLLFELEMELGLVNPLDAGSKSGDERSQIYQALNRLEELRKKYATETITQTIHRAVQEGKLRSYRNHDDYEKMIRREDIEEEIEKIVEKQSEFGAIPFDANAQADFVDALKGCITDQDMPTIDENLFGKCSFYKTETAAPKYSYLYDLYRLYKKLSELRIDHYEITPEDRRKIVEWIQKRISQGKNTKKLTYKDLRKILGLEEDQKIFGQEDEQIIKGKRAPRTFVPFFFISDIAKFKELFSRILSHEESTQLMRQIAEILQRAKTPQEYRQKILELLTAHGIDADDREILELFKNKKPGTLELSHRYILDALPLFLEGMEEKEIQRHLGVSDSEDYGDYPKSLRHLHLGRDNLFEESENLINNHAVKSLASWALGLIADLSWRHGPFDEIIIESARDTLPEKRRKEIDKAMKEREKHLDEIIEKYKKDFPTIDRRLARKIQLWEQQEHLNLYSGQTIGMAQLLDGSADIEHIVPRTLGGLSTGYNTIVALKSTNAQKGNRLPGDWLDGDAEYRRRVEMLFSKGKIDWKKRKNLLATNLDEIFTESFDTKGLRATSYLEALVVQVLKRFYPFPDPDARRNGKAVRMIPGRTTSRARNLLRIKSKSRETNWHHAEDAMILATISRGWQNRLHRMLRENYGKSEEELQKLWKEYEPHIEGLTLRDYVAESYERFMSKGDESLFYRDMFGGVRTVSYRVDRKPLSASSHKDTVYSARHDVPTLRKPILDAFAALDVFKNRHKLSAEDFMKKYDKEIRQKLWLHRLGNYNDPSYRAVEERAAQIAATITEYQMLDAQNDKAIDERYQSRLRELLDTPIIAAGKEVRKMRFVYDKLNAIEIDRGLVETDKNMLGIYIEKGDSGKLKITRMDVNNRKELESRSGGMKVYLNEMLFLFNARGLIHYGCLRSFLINKSQAKYIALFNPRFPANPKAQPEKFSTGSQIKQVSVGSARGAIKAHLDLDGHVKSYEVIGELTPEQIETFKRESGYGGVEDPAHH
ncbi:type II CRISPR RNA-guided endonuclease Cas9 [Nitratifractor sp.]